MRHSIETPLYQMQPCYYLYVQIGNKLFSAKKENTIHRIHFLLVPPSSSRAPGTYFCTVSDQICDQDQE